MLWPKINKKTTGHKKNTGEKQKQVLTGDKKKKYWGLKTIYWDENINQ